MINKIPALGHVSKNMIDVRPNEWRCSPKCDAITCKTYPLVLHSPFPTIASPLLKGKSKVGE